MTDSDGIAKLRELNTRLVQENQQLVVRVKALEQELARLRATVPAKSPTAVSANTEPPKPQSAQVSLEKDNPLSLPEYLRYGRQLILPEFGLPAQIKLKNTSVLVVGAGGLGAPAAMYLTAAGVGRIGIVDYDIVDVSNLQRQVIHSESRIGISKARSAKMTVQELNSFCECVVHETLLDSSNALGIVKQYDVIVDASDNAATRYLLNDACVLACRPLVSGSALRTDGQLTVYNYRGGPCYRCLFPNPPPPETVLNCVDGGVLGVVTGVIGCLQALLAIKIATGILDESEPYSLLVFSATSYPLFRSVKLRSRKPTCAVCGEQPTITELQDYVAFCGSNALEKSSDVALLAIQDRINVKDYSSIRTRNASHVLVDVREPVQFEICSLPGSINIPLRELSKRLQEVKKILPLPTTAVFAICRLGNDSQYAVQILKSITQGEVKDIIGGLRQWATDIDPEFPVY